MQHYKQKARKKLSPSVISKERRVEKSLLCFRSTPEMWPVTLVVVLCGSAATSALPKMRTAPEECPVQAGTNDSIAGFQYN